VDQKLENLDYLNQIFTGDRTDVTISEKGFVYHLTDTAE
jgi:hypothetical protein